MIIGIILYGLLGWVMEQAGVTFNTWHGFAIVGIVFAIDMWTYIGARKGK